MRMRFRLDRRDKRFIKGLAYGVGGAVCFVVAVVVMYVAFTVAQPYIDAATSEIFNSQVYESVKTTVVNSEVYETLKSML
ncbi:MAG: hypothetical protein SV760_05565 [Halobacteria archaeon]|nr:hypothetical protein [Halobacteria archaeon]